MKKPGAQLVPACFTTGRSLRYTPCLLGIVQLDQGGMSAWCNQHWEPDTLLDLEFFQEDGSRSYATCLVQTASQSSKRLHFYRLVFLEPPTKPVQGLLHREPAVQAPALALSV